MKHLTLTKKEFDGLPDYSCSNPTGPSIGKRWKRALDYYDRSKGYYVCQAEEDPDPAYVLIKIYIPEIVASNFEIIVDHIKHHAHPIAIWGDPLGGGMRPVDVRLVFDMVAGDGTRDDRATKYVDIISEDDMIFHYHDQHRNHIQIDLNSPESLEVAEKFVEHAISGKRVRATDLYRTSALVKRSGDQNAT